jgi:hypothetical protein
MVVLPRPLTPNSQTSYRVVLQRAHSGLVRGGPASRYLVWTKSSFSCNFFNIFLLLLYVQEQLRFQLLVSSEIDVIPDMGFVYQPQFIFYWSERHRLCRTEGA